MILYINTTSANEVEVAIKDDGAVLDSGKVPAHRAQAEKLLPLIDSILKKNKISFKDIEKIQVVNIGDDSSSFTALRIGVVTANALGYALGVPVESVEREIKKTKKPAYRTGRQKNKKAITAFGHRICGTSGIPPTTEYFRGRIKQENGLNFDVVEPVYSRGPNITKKKNKI